MNWGWACGVELALHKAGPVRAFPWKVATGNDGKREGKEDERNRDMKLPFPWSCLMISSRMNEVPLYPCSWAP